MNVSEIMTVQAVTCAADDSLERIAQQMWEHDCGCIPLVDRHGKPVAIITDRDICMAAYTKGEPLSAIPASLAAARDVVAIHANDSVDRAEALMREHQVRRLPVIDAEGRLVGILSVNDLVRGAHVAHRPDGLSPDNVISTLASIGETRG